MIKGLRLTCTALYRKTVQMYVMSITVTGIGAGLKAKILPQRIECSPIQFVLFQSSLQYLRLQTAFTKPKAKISYDRVRMHMLKSYFNA